MPECSSILIVGSLDVRSLVSKHARGLKAEFGI
jgi:hypothetical protein